MSQSEIKEKNDYLDKIIDKSKSFEDQIKSLEKVEIQKCIGVLKNIVIKS